MSFRSRLLLFFVFIVIVPMVSLAVVLFRLISDNENGKADARVAARQEAAIRLYEEAQRDAGRGAASVGRDLRFSTALQQQDRAAAERRGEQLLNRYGLKRIVVTRGSRTLADVGSRTATFPAARRLVDARGREVGRLRVSAAGPKAYAERVQRLTGLDVVVRRGGRTLVSTLRGAEQTALPANRGEVTVDGEEYRAASFVAAGFEAPGDTVAVLDPEQRVLDEIGDARLVAGVILGCFFVLAFAFAVLVSRSLQRQIASFLGAAQRLGQGDFDAKVPTVGRDEFARLGDEFNRMSGQLEQRLEELDAERARLQDAMRRIGETFAANLDRDALLKIVLRTALDGTNGTGGRATLRGGPGDGLRQVAHAGTLDDLDAALHAAESAVLETGAPRDAQAGDVHALAYPLRAAATDADGPPRITGIVAIARRGEPFTARDRELFEYLAGQASVSVENVGLHETVERQATTDELTGLANRRQFQETLSTEVERSRRFGQPVGLVMLDIDNFKRVNDTYGHQAGDLVLREVAAVLRSSAREIDEPARYGGEELAAVLPGTDLEGAFNLAERVREGIAALDLPIRTADGAPLKITASFGAATVPSSAGDVRELIAAADAALYDAKRSGKNRTVRAAALGST